MTTFTPENTNSYLQEMLYSKRMIDALNGKDLDLLQQFVNLLLQFPHLRTAVIAALEMQEVNDAWSKFAATELYMMELQANHDLHGDDDL